MSIAWGLLWYDGDPKRSLEEKVRRAAERYTEKFGATPDTCIVHPDEVAGDIVVQGGYKVIPHYTVLKNHLWIGEA